MICFINMKQLFHCPCRCNPWDLDYDDFNITIILKVISIF